MKPLPHHYSVRLAGGPDGYAEASAEGRPALRVAAPQEYDGPGDAWSPEHLLLAAVQSCVLLTFRAVARLSKVAFVSLELEAEGTVDRQDGVTRFTGIVLRPKLVVPRGTDHARARSLLEKAEKGCLVSASLAASIRMEPDIVDADAVTP